MRILTLTNCPVDEALGSGKTVLRYSEGLRRLGHDVDVLAPTQYELWPSVGRGKQLRQAAGALMTAQRALRARRYDVVELYGAEFWALALRLSRLRLARPLTVSHTNGLELLHYERERQYMRLGTKTSISRTLHEPLLRQTFERTDRFVALCDADRQYVLAHGLYTTDQTAVVGPGLDSEFRAALDRTVTPRADRICFNGSWLPRKGIGVVIEVIGRVLRAHEGCAADLFGIHEQDRARAIGAFPEDLRRRVTVHPKLSERELVERLERSKVFLFPSEYEGYGLALAEAMACGLAAVTTPTGLGAMLTPGSEAMVCDFGDAKAMSAAVTQLLADDALRLRLTVNARARVRGLDWDASAASLSALYARWHAECASA